MLSERKLKNWREKKNEFRNERELLKEKIEVAKNKILVGTQLKEKKIQQVKEKEKLIKKLKTKNKELKTKLKFLSIEEYDKEISRLQKENKEENKSKIHDLQVSRSQCQNYYREWEKQVSESQALKELKDELAAIETDMKENNENRKKYTHALSEMKEDESVNEKLIILNKEYADNRKKLRDVRDELKRLLDQLKGQNEALYKKRNDIKESIKQLKRTKESLVDEVEQWSSLLVTHKIEFKSGQARLLQANKFEKIKKIKEQSKVDITIPKDANFVMIRGTEDRAEKALRAVEKLLQSNDREEASIRFKPDMVDLLLRKGTLSTLKKKTNSKLFVDKLDGTIRIETEKSNLNNAKKIINQFLEDNSPVEMTIPAEEEICSVLITMTKRIRESSNVSHIFVDLKKQAIDLAGTKVSVQKAKETIDELIQQIKANKELIQVSKDVLALIIGKGGKNIRRIEKETGAIISVDPNKPVVTLRGNEKSIKQAKEEIAKIAPLTNAEIKV